jgi:adenine deaminase
VTVPPAALTPVQRRRLTAVARGESAADLYVRGGTLLNVYTGEIYPANVAIAGERIAYVGLRDDMVGPRTRTLDAAGHILVPGYIDPHVHPAHVVTPSSMARHLLPLGTTTVFADTLQIWELGGLRAFRVVADALAASPLKFYWMIRVHAQARTTDEARRYPLRDLARALAHPWAFAAGEITRWPEVFGGSADLLGRLDLALSRGQRSRATPRVRPPTRSRRSRPAASARTTSRSPRARCSTARGRASRSCCASRRYGRIWWACWTRSRRRRRWPRG